MTYKLFTPPTMSKRIYPLLYQLHHQMQSLLAPVIKQVLLGLFLLISIGASYTTTYAETITVPSKITFANMQLHISPSAKKEIEEKVKSLTASPTHYQILLDRVNLYMPIIEKILKEEGMPEDFKYLIIQESALISDQVSESNAVGFWQFKQEAATEVGMQINSHIDERMHIVEATRGFAKYVKKHYSHFNNWLYSLLGFYLGRGGTILYIKEKKWHIKPKKAAIDHRAHWYIYHFIAHKLVFQKVIGKKKHPHLRLYEYKASSGKQLAAISRHFEVPLQHIQEYNKWLKTTEVPTNTRCAIIVPLKHGQYKRLDTTEPATKRPKKDVIDYSSYYQHADKFPTIALDNAPKRKMNHATVLPTEALLINGIPGIVAKEEDTLASLTERGNILLSEFLTYNDITAEHLIQTGQVYYFQKKHSKGPIHYHITQPAETWWSIAQKYGVQLSALWHKNRMKEVTDLQLGQVVWLRFIRPARIPIDYVQTPDLKDDDITTQSMAQESQEEEESLQVEMVSLDL